MERLLLVDDDVELCEISDISHELRSPLARVNATLGLARQRLGQNALFDRLERDSERLNEMIGRLLTHL